MIDGNVPIPDDVAGRRRRRLLVRKRLYQRLWGGRTASETPLVVFLAGNAAVGRGYIIDAFERNLETDLYRSNNAQAFVDGELRSNDTLRRLIARSRAPAVVFVTGRSAPAIGELIEHFSPARALWFYEDYWRFIIRARRAGDVAVAREHIRQLPDRAEGYSDMPEALIRLSTTEKLDADIVWALIWYELHSGFRRQRMQRRKQVYIISEESLNAAPRETMNWLFEVVGVGIMNKYLPRRVKKPRRGKPVPELPLAVQHACDELFEWLQAHSVDSTAHS